MSSDCNSTTINSMSADYVQINSKCEIMVATNFRNRQYHRKLVCCVSVKVENSFGMSSRADTGPLLEGE